MIKTIICGDIEIELKGIMSSLSAGKELKVNGKSYFISEDIELGSRKGDRMDAVHKFILKEI